jgi:hypothetical protein
MSHDERRKNRFNLTVGHQRSGGTIMSASVDEIRFSNIVRYTKDFNVPSSFSRKLGAYGAKVSEPVVPTGLPLLFNDDKSGSPLQFGLRKYVFIDDAIIDTSFGVEIRMNQPTGKQKTDFKPKKSAWRPTVVDIGNKVYLYVPEGYDSELGRTLLYTSTDGIHFTEHKDSPVIKDLPLYGTFFEDKNPNILPEEKYKLTSWIGNRGINLFFSPDGIHWRRNETLILPLVSGGSAEAYYDDQQGRYMLLIRRDTSFRTSTCPGGARQCIMFETKEPTKTWLFQPLNSPYYEGWTLPAVTCEGPVIFDETISGQAYRSRTIKYPWAPDVYLAFVWRYPSDQGDDPARHVDLGISRNGKQWKFFEPTQGWYIPTADDPDPEQLSIYGYGFVSVDGSGFIITKPLVFTGEKVKLVLNSTGSIKVAVLDEKGEGFTDYSIQKCDVITDSVTHTVTWAGNSDLTDFSEKPVRFRFELLNSKLFTFELIQVE